VREETLSVVVALLSVLLMVALAFIFDGWRSPLQAVARGRFSASRCLSVMCVASDAGLLPLKSLFCMVMRRRGRGKKNRNQHC
jgi:hypothetical protein